MRVYSRMRKKSRAFCAMMMITKKSLKSQALVSRSITGRISDCYNIFFIKDSGLTFFFFLFFFSTSPLIMVSSISFAKLNFLWLCQFLSILLCFFFFHLFYFVFKRKLYNYAINHRRIVCFNQVCSALFQRVYKHI